MGHTFGVKCEKCTYSFEATVGHGMLGCGFLETNPNTCKPYFYEYFENDKIINDIHLILRTGQNVREDEDTYLERKAWRGHGSAQYYCSECGRLYNRYYFRLIFTGGEYDPEYFCEECGTQLILIDLENSEIPNWHCPLCEHNRLIYDNNIPFILYD